MWFLITIFPLMVNAGQYEGDTTKGLIGEEPQLVILKGTA